MSHEENPSAAGQTNLPHDSSVGNQAQPEPSTLSESEFAEIVEAQLASDLQPDMLTATLIENATTAQLESQQSQPPGPSFGKPSTAVPSIPANMDNIAANGGAVGAMVLGSWALVGSFITSWSVVNALLGLMLGLWGLSSRKRRWAVVGMVLCAVSVFFTVIQVSTLVNSLLQARDDYQG